jgi:hypothetical protein
MAVQGFWDSRAAATAARRIVEIGEQGRAVLAPSDVPEIARVRQVKMKVDVLRRNVAVRYLKWVGDGDMNNLQQIQDELMW